MVIDTSALLAILFKEAEHARFIADILADATRLTSAVTVVEASVVALARKGEAGLEALGALRREADIQTVAVTEEHATLAIGAFRRFGKGRHPAGLNLGDCFAYALAQATGEALLFKGGDFALTDIGRVA